MCGRKIEESVAIPEAVQEADAAEPAAAEYCVVYVHVLLCELCVSYRKDIHRSHTHIVWTDRA